MCKGFLRQALHTNLQECQSALSGGACRGSSSSPSTSVKPKCPKTVLTSRDEALENALDSAADGQEGAKICLWGCSQSTPFFAQEHLSSSVLPQSKKRLFQHLLRHSPDDH